MLQNLVTNDETSCPCTCYLRSHYCWSSGTLQHWALYTHLPSFIIKPESSWVGRTWEVDANTQGWSRLDYISDRTLVFKKRVFLAFKKGKPVHFHLHIPPPGPHCFMSEEMNSPEQLQSPAGRKPRKLHRLSIVQVTFCQRLKASCCDILLKKMPWKDPVL